jgi:CO dehydrogenase maturation factor
MTFTVAVAGKGGVGKTTFSALTVRHLHETTGEVVLAVDADPNSNLSGKLGTEPGRTLGSIREELVSLGEEPPPGMSKPEYIDYQVKLALKEGDGFDLVTMGRQEGPGCYCFVNNLLRNVVDSLSAKYAYVVVDNEAGMEHLSRRTTKATDVLFVVADASRASLDAARRIASLADEMRIKVGNKALVRNMADPSEPEAVPEPVDGFDSVHVVRRSSRIRSDSERSESLMALPRNDPAFSDVAKAVDAVRKVA